MVHFDNPPSNPVFGQTQQQNQQQSVGSNNGQQNNNYQTQQNNNNYQAQQNNNNNYQPQQQNENYQNQVVHQQQNANYQNQGVSQQTQNTYQDTAQQNRNYQNQFVVQQNQNNNYQNQQEQNIQASQQINNFQAAPQQNTFYQQNENLQGVAQQNTNYQQIAQQNTNYQTVGQQQPQTIVSFPQMQQQFNWPHQQSNDGENPFNALMASFVNNEQQVQQPHTEQQQDEPQNNFQASPSFPPFNKRVGLEELATLLKEDPEDYNNEPSAEQNVNQNSFYPENTDNGGYAYQQQPQQDAYGNNYDISQQGNLYQFQQQHSPGRNTHLPDDVPQELRDQLTKSGILGNADVQVRYTFKIIQINHPIE